MEKQHQYFYVGETRQQFEERKQQYASLIASLLVPPSLSSSLSSPSLSSSSSFSSSLPSSWPSREELEVKEVLKAREILLALRPSLKAMEPIFITGSSGYLGMSLVYLLENLNIKTKGFDLIPSPPPPSSSPSSSPPSSPSPSPSSSSSSPSSSSSSSLSYRLSTHVVGDVGEEEDVRRGMEGCRGVIHCAALHAPNLPFCTEEQFEQVNVKGTENILKMSVENNINNIVFSSTTSLTISPMLKEKEKEKKEKGRYIVIGDKTWGIVNDLDTQKKEGETEIATDTSRNAYGRTKRKAETLCFSYVEREKEKEKERREGGEGGEEGLRVAILRCSRFFLEDVFDSDLFKKPTTTPTNTPEHHQPQPKPTITSPNTKANELFSGVRISLIDLLLTHLLSLSLLYYHPTTNTTNTTNTTTTNTTNTTPPFPFPPLPFSSSSFVIGPLITSSPSPLLLLKEKEKRQQMLQKKKKIYQKLQWKGKIFSTTYPPLLSSSPSLSLSLPPTPSIRLYDSSTTWKTLGWAPFFDFIWLLHTLDGEKGREGEGEGDGEGEGEEKGEGEGEGVQRMAKMGLY